MKYLQILSMPVIMSLFIINSVTAKVYEDAEDGKVTGWKVYDNTPTGAKITNVRKNPGEGKCIQVEGSNRANS